MPLLPIHSSQSAEVRPGCCAPHRASTVTLHSVALLRLHSHRTLSPPARDGVPPYRTRKQHRREMQESVQVNGRVPLPHIPVSSGHTATPTASPRSGLTSLLGPCLSLLPPSQGHWAVARASLASFELSSRPGVACGQCAVTPYRLVRTAWVACGPALSFQRGREGLT